MTKLEKEEARRQRARQFLAALIKRATDEAVDEVQRSAFRLMRSLGLSTKQDFNFANALLRIALEEARKELERL